MFRIGFLALALAVALIQSADAGDRNRHSNGYRGHRGHTQHFNHNFRGHYGQRYHNYHRQNGGWGSNIHWNGGGAYWGKAYNQSYQRPQWNYHRHYRW